MGTQNIAHENTRTAAYQRGYWVLKYFFLHSTVKVINKIIIWLYSMKESNIIYYIFLKLIISYFIEVCDFNCPNKNFYTHTVWVTASTQLIAVSFLMWHDIMHAMPYTIRRMCFFMP